MQRIGEPKTSRQKEPSLCHSGPTELKPWFWSLLNLVGTALPRVSICRVRMRSACLSRMARADEPRAKTRIPTTHLCSPLSLSLKLSLL